MLDSVNLLLQRIKGVVLGNLNRTLGHDGTLVVLGVGEMHRHARHLHASVEGVGDGVGSLEGGQQRRMQVQHAIGEGIQNFRQHHAHVASHDQVLRTGRLALVGDELVGSRSIRIDLLVQHQRGNARSLGPLNAIGIGTRGNHLHDLGVHRTIGDAIDDGLQIGAGTADKNGDLQRLRHRYSSRS